MRCLYPLDCKLRAGEGRSVGDECSYRDVDGCRVMCMRSVGDAMPRGLRLRLALDVH